MKRYATVYSNGHAVESSSPQEAMNWLCYDDAQTFALAGKPVSAVEFYAAARAAVQAKWDKKLETHKQVRVPDGVSGLVFKTIWIRK